MPACGDRVDDDPGDRISVVASFYPLRFAADGIGGDCVNVTNLTPPGMEPHQPRADARRGGVDRHRGCRALSRRWVPAHDKQRSIQDSQGEVVDLLDAVATTPAEGEEAEEGLLVDPTLARPGQVRGDRPGDGGRLRPHGEGRCLRRVRRIWGVALDLVGLDAEFRSTLDGCERDVLVTNHAAFGYLASAYGLRQEAIAGLEPEGEPSAKRLAEVEELVEREGVTTILTEELVSPDVAETLAAETGVETAVLFTIEGLTDVEAAAGDDYLSLMRDNLETLRVALGCL